jgi:hypothetical protein
MDRVVDAVAEPVSALWSASEDDVRSVEIDNSPNDAVERQPDVMILRVKLAVNRNAVAVCDRRDKNGSRGRIDGIVALAMAVGAAEAPQAGARF